MRKINGLRWLVLAGVALLGCGVHAADWWATQALAMPVRPEAGMAVLQNPPVLSWPLRPEAKGYEVQMSTESSLGQYKSTQNVLALKVPLALGKHVWKVRALDAAGAPITPWSDERSFVVGAEAEVFVVADAQALMKQAQQTPRPRGLPRGADWQLLTQELQTGRAADWAKLKAKLQKKVGSALLTEPSTAYDRQAPGLAKTQAMGDLRTNLQAEQDTITGYALLWRLERNRLWLDEGKRRALALARWAPQGSTGVVSHNQATRTILFGLAVALDGFYDEWSADEKQVLVESIRKRYADLFNTIVASGSLATNPYNSWGSYTLGYLVAVAPLIAGDVPEANAWMASAWPLYALTFPAWSGDDGGYANGTAYGVWDVPESIFLWDVLRNATGFDFYKKPAVKNFGTFMAYFLPPGGPEGVFGDGADVRMAPSIARYGKAFAARTESPVMPWYARQLFGEDKEALAVLTAPPLAVRSAELPSSAKNGAYFPSIGWAAMHSSLADRSRLSVYFKSSPYGSWNHSHADQNSFVIHAHGKVFAMDSGVYDYYNSPHWREWYKQTRAHNAITYDGGRGQGLGPQGTGSKEFNGKVNSFVTTAAYDLVEGDATAAYQGELTVAKRWVALVRPDTVVVVDQLGASVPRQWEWNLHTTSKPSASGDFWLTKEDGLAFCTRVSAPAELTYQMAEGYSPAPESTGARLPHYGSRFFYTKPSAQGFFVSVMRMDCEGAPPTVTWKGNNAEIRVNGVKLLFSGSALTIQ